MCNKRNTISARPGTKQIIAAQVDNAKYVFQEMWDCKTVTIFWNSRSLKLVDTGIASPLSKKKCSKHSLACVVFVEF